MQRLRQQIRQEAAARATFRPRAAEHQVVVAHVLSQCLQDVAARGNVNRLDHGCAQRQVVAQRRGGRVARVDHIHVTARKHPRQCQRKRVIAA
ncbi:hypothetical protein D3C85_1548410 [compost metagenome]